MGFEVVIASSVSAVIFFCDTALNLVGGTRKFTVSFAGSETGVNIRMSELLRVPQCTLCFPCNSEVKKKNLYQQKKKICTKKYLFVES